MPWQGSEIQASASSRASPSARRLGGGSPLPSAPGLLPGSRSGKPCGGVAWGAAGGPRGWIYPSALCHCSGCCSKHPSPHQRVGALTGSCLPGGTADGKCNQKGLFSWLYAGCRSAEARLGSRWRGQGQGLWVCKVTAGRGAEGHSGCQHCPVTSLGVRGGCNAPHPALPTLPSTATEQGQLFLAENCALSSGEGAAPQPPTLLLVAFQQNAARVTLVFLSAPGRERISFLPLNVGSWCEHWGFLSPQLRAPPVLLAVWVSGLASQHHPGSQPCCFWLLAAPLQQELISL